MKSRESMPLVEEVGEVTARTEDRAEAILVPAIERIVGTVAETLTAAKERLASLRR